MKASVRLRFRPDVLAGDDEVNTLAALPRSDGVQTILPDPKEDGWAGESDAYGNRLWATKVRKGEIFERSFEFASEGYRLGSTKVTLPWSRENLEPTPLVTWTEEMRALAQSLVVGLESDLERSRAIFRWVRDNVKYTYPLRARGATTVFGTRRGDCGESALLFSALCRAVGIAARPVMGFFVGCGANMGLHAWAEAWVEPYGWIPVDPSIAAAGRVAWSRLGVREADREWFFGNLDARRVACARGTGHVWPFAPLELKGPAPRASVMKLDGEDFAFWCETREGQVPYLQLPYFGIQKPKPRVGWRAWLAILRYVRVTVHGRGGEWIWSMAYPAMIGGILVGWLAEWWSLEGPLLRSVQWVTEIAILGGAALSLSRLRERQWWEVVVTVVLGASALRTLWRLWGL